MVFSIYLSSSCLDNSAFRKSNWSNKVPHSSLSPCGKSNSTPQKKRGALYLVINNLTVFVGYFFF